MTPCLKYRAVLAAVGLAISVVMIAVFLVACLGIVWWFFKTGYKIKK